MPAVRKTPVVQSDSLECQRKDRIDDDRERYRDKPDLVDQERVSAILRHKTGDIPQHQDREGEQHHVAK
jgi:hypothetical protein